MNRKQLADRLELQRKRLSLGTDKLHRWLQLEDVLCFLRDAVDGWVPLYVSSQLYLFSVLIPEDRLDGDSIDDILGWNMDALRVWSYNYEETSSGLEVSLYPPLSHTGSALLDGGEPIFSLREFPGVRCYAELSQRVAQLLGIHWMENRRAFCTLDENGDFVDVASIDEGDHPIVCSMERKYLDLYMLMTRSVVIRLFDVVRLVDGGMVEASRRVEPYVDEQSGIWARQGMAFDPQGEPVAGWLRGVQIIRRQTTDAQALVLLSDDHPREYETFLAWDWKNHLVREWSCDPAQLANYYEKSDLPYETSPAFFKPDVLAHYKSDPGKYELTPYWIKCRGAWSLTYDVNEEGQVHAYLYDLSRLPYGEQLRWKSFNEVPRAGIAASAFKTDFLAEPDDSYDPLVSLVHVLNHFPLLLVQGQEMGLWRPDEELLKRLNYVITDSEKEWKDAVLNLAKLLVDGLDKGNILKVAKHLHCDDSELRSIKQLAKCLEVAGLDSNDVDAVVAPLGELWHLRSSKGIAHRGTVPDGNKKTQFKELLERCDRSMQTLATSIRDGRLGIGCCGSQ